MQNTHALPCDIAFWTLLGAAAGVGSYLVAGTPFWVTLGIHAAGFLGYGLLIRAHQRRT